MIEEPARTTLQQQQWTLVSKDRNPLTQESLIISAWKHFANGVAITLSIYDEGGQFVLYQDVGHAACGNKRTNCGTFSTADAAEHQLIQECDRWDRTWGM